MLSLLQFITRYYNIQLPIILLQLAEFSYVFEDMPPLHSQLSNLASLPT